jgi:serine/threonine-protein kinase RsbW
MTVSVPQVVRLQFTSSFDMLDFVQLVTDHVGGRTGLDDDSMHWVGVAVREAVINAIRHGNRSILGKQVFVEFETTASQDAPRLTIRVRDQGQGFDPELVADPLASENLLKSSGRGILLMRSFMDEVQLRRVPEGGMEVCMTKRVRPAGVSEDSTKA